jgi:hypothetical protein
MTMNTSTNRAGMILVLGAIAMGLMGCQCIQVPAHDSTRPRAALTISYIDPSTSREAVVTITSDDLGNPPPVVIPMDRAFHLLYSGNDEGGVRTLTLEFVDLDPPQPVTSGNSTSYPLVALPSIPNGDFSSCAKTTRVLNVDWMVTGRQTWKVTAIDFHGNQASTPVLNIRPN